MLTPHALTPLEKEAASLAIREAELGILTTSPNPSVGCVLLKDGAILAKAHHKKSGEPHAEALALKAAGAQAKGATAVVTLEPCAHHGRTPPCAEALLAAGVKKLIALTQDPNPKVSGRGLARLRSGGVEVLLLSPSQLPESDRKKLSSLNRGFFKRMTTGLPWLRAKVAQSLDGKIALNNGLSQWITSEESRQDAHFYRARSDALITGIGTALKDNPSLNARLSPPAPRQPLRILLDSSLRLPRESALLALPLPLWILTKKDSLRSPKALEFLRDFPYLNLLPLEEESPLSALLSLLGGQEHNEVLLESGPTLLHSFLQEDLVDELLIYQSPKLLGNSALSAFMGSCETLPEAKWRFDTIEPLGPDIRLSLLRLNSSFNPSPDA